MNSNPMCIRRLFILLPLVVCSLNSQAQLANGLQIFNRVTDLSFILHDKEGYAQYDYNKAILTICNLPLFRTGCKYTSEQIVLRCHLETETSSAEEQLARDTDEPRRISNCAVLFVRRIFCSYSLCIMP